MVCDSNAPRVLLAVNEALDCKIKVLDVDNGVITHEIALRRSLTLAVTTAYISPMYEQKKRSMGLLAVHVGRINKQ